MEAGKKILVYFVLPVLLAGFSLWLAGRAVVWMGGSELGAAFITFFWGPFQVGIGYVLLRIILPHTRKSYLISLIISLLLLIFAIGIESGVLMFFLPLYGYLILLSGYYWVVSNQNGAANH